MTTLTLDASFSQSQVARHAAPVAKTAAQTQDIQVKGKTLIVRSGVVLPPVCVVTNQPVSSNDLTCSELHGYSRLSLLLFFVLTGPLLLILFPLTRRKCTLAYAVHPDVQQKYRVRRRNKMLATLLGFVGFGAAAAFTTSAPLLITTGCIAALLLLGLGIGNSPIRVAYTAFGKFYIKGCSQEYLQRIATSQNSSH